MQGGSIYGLNVSLQIVPRLEGVEELLNIPLDEDCLHRLLSGADHMDHFPTSSVTLPHPSSLDLPLICDDTLEILQEYNDPVVVGNPVSARVSSC